MKRSGRLEPVAELAAQTERSSAARLGAISERMRDAAGRGVTLRRYLQEYQEQFQARAADGISVSNLRDFQVFIARLAQAVQQHQQLIAQLEEELERERQAWYAAAARRSALGSLLAEARSEDRKLEERQVQRELDEQAQRSGDRL